MMPHDDDAPNQPNNLNTETLNAEELAEKDLDNISGGHDGDGTHGMVPNTHG